MNLFLFGLTCLAFIVHLLLMKQRTAKKIVEIIVLYLLAITVGFGAIIAGLFHIFNGPATAALIGWPAGSPFQYEVGVADLAFGMVALLGLFFRGNYWLAAILANGIFLIGCMIGHVRSLAESGNTAAYNIGPNIIISDLVVPLVLLGLYLVYAKMRD
ncbi:MAG: hypothetical protein PHH14_03060 [Candidatus Margulisbacteria bacterium]|nr:hypothetical protein [Candidatus Margulisiibacteriota bacterium]